MRGGRVSWLGGTPPKNPLIRLFNSIFLLLSYALVLGGPYAAIYCLGKSGTLSAWSSAPPSPDADAELARCQWNDMACKARRGGK